MMIPEDTIELAGTVMRMHGRLSTSGPAIFVSKFVSNDFYHIIDNILNTISYYCHRWVLVLLYWYILFHFLHYYVSYI